MSEKVKQAIFYCEKNGQGHLKEYMKPVFSERSLKLANQILETDLQHINNLYKNISNPGQIAEAIPDISTMDVFDLTRADPEEIKELYQSGMTLLADRQFAAITLAGGQGTRLGHSGPKGTFILNVAPPVSLFEIQCKQLLKISNITGSEVPWLIMTSEENHDATKDFFEKNNFFGYNPEIVRFFPQGMIPLIDFEGKILVDKYKIAKGPDGNGGIFSQLKKSGNLKWLKEMNIRKVFICGIDNPLVKMADPVFIGFSEKNKSEIVCKSVLKKSWNENAGVFCRKNNRPHYVEYTDIPEEKAMAINEDGSYKFGDVGIVMYIYDIAILDRIAQNELPYHEARKKIPFILPGGERVIPETVNGIKYETFIFDSFNYAESVSVMRVSRENEFAPIKNKNGDDSPEIAEELYMKAHKC